MDLLVIVKVDGREVADIRETVSTAAAMELEQHTEQLKDRVGKRFWKSVSRSVATS